MLRPDHQEEPTTREETWSSLEDSDDCLDKYLNYPTHYNENEDDIIKYKNLIS